MIDNMFAIKVSAWPNWLICKGLYLINYGITLIMVNGHNQISHGNNIHYIFHIFNPLFTIAQFKCFAILAH